MKNKWVINIFLIGLMDVMYAGCETHKEVPISNMCIEYSGCLTKDDFPEVKKFLSVLTAEDRNDYKVFEKYLRSDLIDEHGNYDKEVLFEFLGHYTTGKYYKNKTTKNGAFKMSFEKSRDDECGEYVYRYTTTPREGEYTTWLKISRDNWDGRVKIIQMGKAG